MSKSTLGLDLGIASIGWCLFEDDENDNHKRIIDLGSFIFDQIEDGKTGQTENIKRRQKRGMRRQRRRKHLRLQDGRSLFKNELDIDFFSLDFKNYLSPMELKIKGLHEKLSKEELCIALYHYLKYRGFKSNKKSEKPSDGKLSKKLSNTENIVKESNMFVTEYMFGKDSNNTIRAKQGKKYHNGSFYSNEKGDLKNQDSYNLNVTRALYLEEINALLDNQINENVITDDFKQKYINLFTRQRDTSEGPSTYSPYHKEIEDLIGKCLYDQKERAPIDSYSFQLFRFLEKLINLRYKIYKDGDFSKEYLKLDKGQILLLKDKLFLKTKNVTYKKVFDTLKIKENILIKGLNLSKSEYIKVKKNLDDKKDTENFDQLKSDELYKAKLGKEIFKTSEFLNEYIDKANKLENEGLKNFILNPQIINKLARVSLVSKTDSKIEKEVEKVDEINKEGLTDFMINLQNEAKKVSNLSLDMIDKINPLLEEGKNYYEALNELGYTSENGETKESINYDCDYLPSVDKMLVGINEELTNPVVKHTLVMLRLLLNEIIKTYGKPTNVCVELGRELRKNFKERQEIQNNQNENRYNNNSCRLEILENKNYGFNTFSSISPYQLLKYKLYKEQNEISPYTNNKISDPFDSQYEIDHIIPYSKSFDDSFTNKVLVEKIKNDEKGNKLPSEVRSIKEQVKIFIQNNHSISDKKREKLLLTSFDPHENDFIEKDANDNAYIAVLARELIEAYVLTNKTKCRTTSGAITEKLRSEWRIGGKTHTYIEGSEFDNSISKSYSVKALEKFFYKDVEFNKKDGKESLDFTFTNIGKDYIYSIVLPKQKNNKELSASEKLKKVNLDQFIASLDYYKNDFKQYVGKSILDIINSKEDYPEHVMFVIGEVYNQIQSDSLKKDRSNNLHHALDAAVIGCNTPTIIKRISDYYQSKELNDDIRTGVVHDSRSPLPYTDFDKEVLIRLYERNLDKMILELNRLSNYQENPATYSNVHIVYPARLPNKDIKGAISDETIYGIKTINNNKILVQKVSVKKLESKDIKDIRDAYGNNKGVEPMITAIEQWIKDGKKTDCPYLPKKNTPIKYVKKLVTTKPETKVNLGKGKFAENSDVVKVMILKIKNNGKYAFAPIYYNQIWKENENTKRIKEGKDLLPVPKYQVMCGKGDNYKYFTMEEIKNNNKFEIIDTITRNALIKIKTNNGEGYAYSGGCSSGSFEVYSLLGDNYDLNNYGLLNNPNTERLLITISSIQNIQVCTMSPLGIIKENG